MTAGEETIQLGREQKFLHVLKEIISRPPTHATVLYLNNEPIGIAGVSRSSRAAESQRAEYNDSVYLANVRGDFEAYRGATYAGTVLISELTPEQQQFLPA